MGPIDNPANDIEEKALVDPAVKKTKESLIKNLQAKKTKTFKEKQKLATLKEEWDKEFRDGGARSQNGVSNDQESSTPGKVRVSALPPPPSSRGQLLPSFSDDKTTTLSTIKTSQHIQVREKVEQLERKLEGESFKLEEEEEGRARVRPENLIGAVRLLPTPSSPTPTPTSSPPTLTPSSSSSRPASQASSRKSSLTRGSSVEEDSRLILCQVKEEPMQMDTEHKIPREVLTCLKSEVQNKEEGDLTTKQEDWDKQILEDAQRNQDYLQDKEDETQTSAVEDWDQETLEDAQRNQKDFDLTNKKKEETTRAPDHLQDNKDEQSSSIQEDWDLELEEEKRKKETEGKGVLLMKTPVQEDSKQEINRDMQGKLFASSHVQLPGKRLEEVVVSVQRTPVQREDWDKKNLEDTIALAPEETNSPGGRIGDVEMGNRDQGQGFLVDGRDEKEDSRPRFSIKTCQSFCGIFLFWAFLFMILWTMT